MPIFYATPDDDHFPGTRGAEDIVSYANAAAFVTIDLRRPGPQPTGGSGMDNLVWIDSLIGSDFNDVLIGSDDSGSLSGGAGDDSIIVHLVKPGALVTLDGGAGVDTLTVDATGLPGSVFFGGLPSGYLFDGYAGTYLRVSGFERLIFEGTAEATSFGPLTGGTGDDILSGLDHDDTFAGGGGNDFIRGRGGNDTVQGGDGYDTITGGEGNDTLRGDDGNDTLHGDTGNDLLYGGAGVDVLYGGTGADRMEGGAGADYYFVDNIGDLVVEGPGSDRDIVTTTISYTLPNNVEEVVSATTDALTLRGNVLNNHLTGGGGKDVVYGGDGSDVLRGGGGDDALNGDGGNDVLFGGPGYDHMSGGAGNDVLYADGGGDLLAGDAGYDRFIFTSLDGRGPLNEIGQIWALEIQLGERIDLSAIDANINTEGVDDSFVYINNAPFSGVAGELRKVAVYFPPKLDVDPVATLYGDVDGDAVADFSIGITNSHYFPSSPDHFFL